MDFAEATSRKYVPNLKGLHSLCEGNYARILKLLPDCDTESLTYEFGEGADLHYRLSILEASRYTTTIEIRQLGDSLPKWMKPVMKVRIYHDARMAEVLSSQNVTAIQPSYRYPNKKMHQKNEKEMVNLFLAEWLLFCLKQQADSTV